MKEGDTMRIRGRLFRGVAIAVLTGLLAGTAIAGDASAAPAGRSTPPPVQVMSDGSVVFTAVPGTKSASAQRAVVCRAYPAAPVNFAHSPYLITFNTTVSCDKRIVMIAMNVTLIHYNNWWVTRFYRQEYTSYLFGSATKSCVNGWYAGRAEVTVTFGIDWTPPSITRTFYTNDVYIGTC
jgi:hypothetical protein